MKKVKPLLTLLVGSTTILTPLISTQVIWTKEKLGLETAGHFNGLGPYGPAGNQDHLLATVNMSSDSATLQADISASSIDYINKHYMVAPKNDQPWYAIYDYLTDAYPNTGTYGPVSILKLLHTHVKADFEKVMIPVANAIGFTSSADKQFKLNPIYFEITGDISISNPNLKSTTDKNKPFDSNGPRMNINNYPPGKSSYNPRFEPKNGFTNATAVYDGTDNFLGNPGWRYGLYGINSNATYTAAIDANVLSKVTKTGSIDDGNGLIYWLEEKAPDFESNYITSVQKGYHHVSSDSDIIGDLKAHSDTALDFLHNNFVHHPPSAAVLAKEKVLIEVDYEWNRVDTDTFRVQFTLDNGDLTGDYTSVQGDMSGVSYAKTTNQYIFTNADNYYGRYLDILINGSMWHNVIDSYVEKDTNIGYAVYDALTDYYSGSQFASEFASEKSDFMTLYNNNTGGFKTFLNNSYYDQRDCHILFASDELKGDGMNRYWVQFTNGIHW